MSTTPRPHTTGGGHFSQCRYRYRYRHRYSRTPCTVLTTTQIPISDSRLCHTISRGNPPAQHANRNYRPGIGFTRVGIPKQVMTDQGSSFMSEVLQAVWKYIEVQLLEDISISLTDQWPCGAVQQNAQMYATFVRDTGKDWPQWVPFLLFAI